MKLQLASFVQYPNEDILVVEDGDNKILKYEMLVFKIF
jgi:hypothetical protein